MNIFETLKGSGKHSPIIKWILKWQVNSSSNFAPFFIVMMHNSSADFKMILFLLWVKGSHHYPNFETLNCSGENLPYSSCHFPNHKSVSWKITPLSFFRSHFVGHICLFFIVRILNIFVCSYCCKLFVINIFTDFHKWCIVYLVFYPVLMLLVWGAFSYNICSNKVNNEIKN